MVYVHATILGGLPVVASVWFTQGDGFNNDDDAGVDTVYWRKRDGSRGAALSQRMMGKLEASDYWWQSDVIEQANNWLMEHCPIRRSNPAWKGWCIDDDDPPQYLYEGSYSNDYKLLNPSKEY